MESRYQQLTPAPTLLPHAGKLVDLVVPQDKVSAIKQDAAPYPSLVLTHRQLCDLELLMNGGFSPLTQFMNQRTYNSVVENMTLPEHNDLLFPMPVTLDLSRAKLAALGEDQHGKPFYDPYAAQELAIAKQEELGIKILPFQMMVYLENHKRYCPIDEVPKGEPVANISGTKLRQLLRTGGEIPSWFTYPEVVRILRSTFPPRDRQGYTIFFTGLSGSGKSTIANALYITLLEDGSRPVTLLDGDVVRQHLSSELGFSKEHRDLNVRRIGYVASEITKSRGAAICAPIAPYAASRAAVRQQIESYGQGAFIEVYVATPIEICEHRDKKGLYAKARAGQLKQFTGIDDPYEVPVKPDILIDTSDISVREALDLILDHLRTEGFIEGAVPSA